MKLNYFLCVYASITSLILLAAPDCLDNSWHMAQRGDLKNYHKVQCNCPCGSFTPNGDYRILANRNTCFKCKHYHNPRQLSVRKKHSYLFSSIDTHSTDMVTSYTHSNRLKYVAKLLRKRLHPQGRNLRQLFSQ